MFFFLVCYHFSVRLGEEIGVVLRWKLLGELKTNLFRVMDDGEKKNKK